MLADLSNLHQMEQDEPPDDPEQQAGNKSGTGRRGMMFDQAPNRHGNACSMHGDREERQKARAEEY
jgi:hypothetical protein